MRARRANSKKLITAPRDENLLAKCVSQKHLAIGYLINLAALLEIRSLEIARSFSHRISCVMSH